MINEKCPLCLHEKTSLIGSGFGRTYVYCDFCHLVFVPKCEHVSSARERAEYDLHENDNSSQSYRRYLGQVAKEVIGIGYSSPKILDFGSCKDYVLTRILREQGYSCEAYDPLYGIGSSALEKKYDIVVLCEVIEHLRDLPRELELIGNLLEPDGALYIRTQFYENKETVPTWWYANDVTHINFFCLQSLQYVAKKLKRKLTKDDGKRCVLMTIDSSDELGLARREGIK